MNLSNAKDESSSCQCTTTLHGKKKETKKIAFRMLPELLSMPEDSRQLADIPTRGSFTRDEWNNLLHLFNISHFGSICCSQNFSSASCPKMMANRMQKGTREEIIVAKSKPTLNLLSKTEASSSIVLSPNASKLSGDTESTEKPVARDSNQNDAASSFQVWQKDAERDESTRRLVALTAKNSESIEGNDTVLPRNFHISTAYVPHLEKVYSNLR